MSEIDMDIIVTSIFVGAILLLICKLANTVFNYMQLCRKLRKIPQKPSHWLFGHSRQVTDSVSYFKYCQDVMKDGGRLYCMWNGPFPIVGVCHPETFKQLIKQESRKARGLTDGYRLLQPWLGEGLLISDGKKWERNRRLLTPAFHFDILSGYVTIMNDVTHLFLNKLAKASKGSNSVDIFPFVCRATLDSMLQCSLSYDGSMQENEEHTYIKALQRIASIMWERMVRPLYLFDTIFNLSPLGRENKRLVNVVHEFTGGLIQKRQKHLAAQPDITKGKKKLDFLDILLTARDEHGHGLSKQEIQDEVDTFTFEGHDTTASAISWAIYALGQNPEAQEKVYLDVTNVLEENTEITCNQLSQFKYLPLFIKEVMRFYGPVPFVARKHSQPIVIDGIEIPPGPRIDINIHVIHHNPDIWKNPEEFNVERFDVERRDETDTYGFIPFSAGTRNCIGQVFAMNEIKITLAMLVKRFRVLPAKGHKAQSLPDIVMRSSNGIQVTLQRRHAQDDA